MSRVDQHTVHTFEHRKVPPGVPYFDQFSVVSLIFDYVTRLDEGYVQKMNGHNCSRSNDEDRAGLAEFGYF